MKLSKMFKIGAVALMVTSLCFVGCKDEESDDELGAISGSNNNYSLSLDATDRTDNYRCYATTKNNHRGALTQIKLDKGFTGEGAAMGYIWDLASTDPNASAEEIARAVSEKPRSFCIVGFGKTSGKYRPYVSRYTNVYDIQADNFGTKLTENKAVETEFIKLSATGKVLTADADGNYIMTVNVYESKDGEGKYDGGYVVDIYNGAVEKADIASATKLDTVTISAEALGYADVDASLFGSHKAAQRQGAVYANVYAKSKVSGSWKYLDTYGADEVVEE